MLFENDDDEELGLVVDVSLLKLKALFVAPLMDVCDGRYKLLLLLLFGCDILSNALGFNLIASS